MPVLEQQGAAEQGEAHQQIVVSPVHHQDHRRIQGHECQRDGTAGTTPDDERDGAEGERGEELEEQAGRELRRSGHRRSGRRQRNEAGAVDGARVTPALRHEMEQRIAWEVGGNLRIRARVVHREQPSVGRVRPEVVRPSRRCEHRDRHQERTRDYDPPRDQDVAPDRRQEQPTERSEGDQRDRDPAAGADRVVPHHEGPSGSHEQNQQRVSGHDRSGGGGPPAAGHVGRRARQRADSSGCPSRALTPCKVGSVTEPVLNVRHASARHGPERD
jgi:hypothetical protein